MQRDINLIRNVFTIARTEWRWCGESPFVGLRMPGDNPPRDQRIPWQVVRRLVRRMGYVTGKPPKNKIGEVAYAFLIALRTAMRAGEILQLGSDTVDLERRVARVAHKTQHLTGRPREVPFRKPAQRLMRALSAGREGLWFTMTSAQLDALFRKMRDSALVHDVHFHDSRAEAATLLARKVDVMTLAKMTGHIDLKLLLQTYYRESAADIAGRLR